MGGFDGKFLSVMLLSDNRNIESSMKLECGLTIRIVLV